MSKWIKIYKSYLGLSASIAFFDKVCFYAGKTDHWGIGFEFSFYDRSITFEIFNLYAGVEFWRKKEE